MGIFKKAEKKLEGLVEGGPASGRVRIADNTSPWFCAFWRPGGAGEQRDVGEGRDAFMEPQRRHERRERTRPSFGDGWREFIAFFDQRAQQ